MVKRVKEHGIPCDGCFKQAAHIEVETNRGLVPLVFCATCAVDLVKELIDALHPELLPEDFSDLRAHLFNNEQASHKRYY